MGVSQRKELAKRSKKGQAIGGQWADRGRLLQAFKTRGYKRKAAVLINEERESQRVERESLPWYSKDIDIDNIHIDILDIQKKIFMLCQLVLLENEAFVILIINTFKE